ncbi:SUKH-4 family immunity protein [Streptomyces sp. TLI_185]|uniref:SUKH-4 family immunity protein n=1 Tax=Streptomyces sp. TLI_185 TaxID=2485151 RepID=UPI000F505BED|nr:SUKH-4 family immunity protein [Streptomyces sp. TLI_185]RPF36730.1 SUKH-4 immunity protein of toxin-antitoxin system [Streptomyces sp. TLI_185]
MPETLDGNWERIEAWRSLPARKRRVFSITGAAAVGKTDFLAQVRRHVPDSVWIDCQGLTADTVALLMREACRTFPAPGDLVIFLANVQYAGDLLTSSQPARVAGVLAPGFRRFGTREVWVMAEHDPELIPVVPNHEYEIALAEQSPIHPEMQQPDVEPWMSALAAAELRKVPPAVWQLLCASVDAPATAEELVALARRRPDILSVVEDDSGTLEVGFVSDAVAHAWRRAWPCEAATQAKVLDALLTAVGGSPEGTWAQGGPVARYASRALPMHAALAGALPRVLDNGRLLAQFASAGLYEALAVAYPNGVPYGSTAALLHYLEIQGIVAPPHGEWVAWLHHAALCAGRTELADQILSAGVELPWRTVWSRWRPLGVFGLRSHDAGRVDELGIAAMEPTLRLITARDTTTGKNASPKYRYLRQEWDPTTGAQISTPVTVRQPLAEGDWDWISASSRPDGPPVVFARHSDNGWENDSPLPSLPPRCPSNVTQGVRLDDIWVLAGKEGLFAVTMHDADDLPQPPFPSKPLVAAHCKSAAWPLPDHVAAALRGEELREWLEETFGAGSCHRLNADQLPPGISDGETHRFLTQTGLPEIRDFLHLSITPRGDRPLPEVPWPGRGRDIPRHLRAQCEAPSGGPFYELGSWMYSTLLLDGTTGRLLRDTTGGMPEPLAGSSLLQFFAMVRLFDEFRRTHHPDAPDHKDARTSLAAWCRRIDPDAAQREVWAHILEGYEFEDSTWDLATYGDEWV